MKIIESFQMNGKPQTKVLVLGWVWLGFGCLSLSTEERERERERRERQTENMFRSLDPWRCFVSCYEKEGRKESFCQLSNVMLFS